MRPLVTLPSAAASVGAGGGESSGRQQGFCSRGAENGWKSKRNFLKLSCSAESENAASTSTAVELTPPVINLEFLGVENLYSLSQFVSRLLLPSPVERFHASC